MKRRRISCLAAWILTTGCAKPYAAFSPAVEARYQLGQEELSGIQFYVGVRDEHNRTSSVVLSHRESSAARAASATLKQVTTVNERDFVVSNYLPGVHMPSAEAQSHRRIDLDVGDGAVLTFRSNERRGGVYHLTEINGAPYTTGSAVSINSTTYVVNKIPAVLLLYDERNTLKVFKNRILAPGRRVGAGSTERSGTQETLLPPVRAGVVAAIVGAGVVRTSPSDLGSVLTTLRVGTKVQVTAVVNEVWAGITVGQRSAYIHVSQLVLTTK